MSVDLCARCNKPKAEHIAGDEPGLLWCHAFDIRLKRANAMDQFTSSDPAERLRDFVRERAPGQCKMLSLGDACICPLCDIARLVDQ